MTDPRVHFSHSSEGVVHTAGLTAGLQDPRLARKMTAITISSTAGTMASAANIIRLAPVTYPPIWANTQGKRTKCAALATVTCNKAPRGQPALTHNQRILILHPASKMTVITISSTARTMASAANITRRTLVIYPSI